MSHEQGVESPLWIDRLSRYAGINRLIRPLGPPELGPYAFAFLILFIDVGILSTLGFVFANRYHPLLENPFWFAAPIGLWYAIWSIRSLSGKYEDLVTTFDLEQHFGADITAESFYDIRTTRIKHGVFLALLVIHVVNFLIFDGWVGVIHRAGPIIGFVKFAIIIPFGYFPIIAEFVGLILASFVGMPRYIVDQKYRVQFDDPMDIGGLEPVGNLIKQSVYVYTFGLGVALSFEYGSSLYSQIGGVGLSPVVFKTAEFTILWVLGVILTLYGLFTIHSYLQRQKYEKISEFDKRMRALGTDNRGFTETEPDEPDYPKLELEYLRLQKVKDMSTLPLTAQAEERMLMSALIPISLEILPNYFM